MCRKYCLAGGKCVTRSGPGGFIASPHFTSALYFLASHSVWPVTSCVWLHGLPDMANYIPSSCEPKQTLSSLSCFFLPGIWLQNKKKINSLQSQTVLLLGLGFGGWGEGRSYISRQMGRMITEVSNYSCTHKASEASQTNSIILHQWRTVQAEQAVDSAARQPKELPGQSPALCLCLFETGGLNEL